jgi:raffinose/stachyose/melibiose transport system substrate-binding protein
LAVDFLKFFSNETNAQMMTKMLGWLSPVNGSTTTANSTPQMRKALKMIQQASGLAIWLDTVTNATVANAYLSGEQALLDGSSTPQKVMSSVQQAAKKAQQTGGD